MYKTVIFKKNSVGTATEPPHLNRTPTKRMASPVSFPKLPVPVEVVEDDEALVACAAEVMADLSQCGPELGYVIGLDCEWRPGSPRLAILQLATSQRVCCIQLQLMYKCCMNFP